MRMMTALSGVPMIGLGCQTVALTLPWYLQVRSRPTPAKDGAGSRPRKQLTTSAPHGVRCWSIVRWCCGRHGHRHHRTTDNCKPRPPPGPVPFIRRQARHAVGGAARRRGYLRAAGTALTCCGRCHPWGASKLRGWWSASRTTRSSGSCAARLCDATRPSSRWRGIACCESKTWRRSGWTPVPARCWRCSGIRDSRMRCCAPMARRSGGCSGSWSPTVGRRGAAGLAQGLDLAAAARQPATGPHPLSGPVGPWRSRGNRLARHH